MYQISLTHYLILASIIFTIGIFGVFLNRKNLIIILMSIELMLLAVNINFIAFSTHLNIIRSSICSVYINSSGRRGSNRLSYFGRLL